jgi:hypothetical protein
MARRRHKRRSRRGISVAHPAGVRGTGLRGDARLTAAAMTRISPTPQGPEPGHGGRMY